MAFGAREDQTESAPPKRRQEARECGQVPKSRELAGALSLLAVVTALWFLGPTIWDGLTRELKQYLQGIGRADLQLRDIQALLSSRLLRQFSLIAPVLRAALVVALLTHILQDGVLFTTDPLLPGFSRLSPTSPTPPTSRWHWPMTAGQWQHPKWWHAGPVIWQNASKTWTGGWGTYHGGQTLGSGLIPPYRGG